MIKHVEKTVFTYEGYDTAFSTDNKELASLIMKSEAKAILTTVETADFKDVTSIVFDNTQVKTFDLALALKVLNFVKETTEDPLDVEIAAIKKQIKDEKNANT